MNTGIAIWRGRALAFGGILLFAFSLRSAVASLSPVVDYIQRDFSLPTVVVGLIGTAPPVCYAIFAMLTPELERRLGLERLSVIAMAVAALGLLARGLAQDSTILLGTTALIFSAVGVGNVVLPPLVRRYFPDRVGLMTALYSLTMALSTLLPPLIAVPVADAAGWRFSLAMWSVFAVAAMVPWIAMLLRERAAPRANIPAVSTETGSIEVISPRVLGRMWRLPMAWAIMTVFAVSGVFAYTSFAWMPEILTDRAEVTPAAAGALLSLFAAMGLPASLLVPLLAVRFRAVRALVGISVGGGMAGLAGLLWAPGVVPWLWIALLGFAPLLFPMSLVLLGLRTRSHEGAVALSGFVQSVGYAVAAVFPAGFGILHSVTGSWSGTLIVLAVVLLCAAPAGLVASRQITIEDQWERRHGPWA